MVKQFEDESARNRPEIVSRQKLSIRNPTFVPIPACSRFAGNWREEEAGGNSQVGFDASVPLEIRRELTGRAETAAAHASSASWGEVRWPSRPRSMETGMAEGGRVASSSGGEKNVNVFVNRGNPWKGPSRGFLVWDLRFGGGSFRIYSTKRRLSGALEISTIRRKRNRGNRGSTRKKFWKLRKNLYAWFTRVSGNASSS